MLKRPAQRGTAPLSRHRVQKRVQLICRSSVICLGESRDGKRMQEFNSDFAWLYGVRSAPRIINHTVAMPRAHNSLTASRKTSTGIGMAMERCLHACNNVAIIGARAKPFGAKEYPQASTEPQVVPDAELFSAHPKPRPYNGLPRPFWVRAVM